MLLVKATAINIRIISASFYMIMKVDFTESPRSCSGYRAVSFYGQDTPE